MTNGHHRKDCSSNVVDVADEATRCDDFHRRSGAVGYAMPARSVTHLGQFSRKKRMAMSTPASLPPITSVEVVSLRDVEVNRVDQYMKSATKAPSVLIRGPDAQRIAELWRSLPPGQQARCHVPPFGLRFSAGGTIVCEASICWKCDNIFGEIQGEQFHYAFEANHPTSMELFGALGRALGEPEPD